jgi:hypothetical protein
MYIYICIYTFLYQYIPIYPYLSATVAPSCQGLLRALYRQRQRDLLGAACHICRHVTIACADHRGSCMARGAMWGYVGLPAASYVQTCSNMFKARFKTSKLLSNFQTMTFTKCSEVSDMINDKWLVILSMAING